MARRKQHGGKREGAGRPGVTDKKVTLTIYPRQSEIEAVGGVAKAREIALNALKKHLKPIIMKTIGILLLLLASVASNAQNIYVNAGPTISGIRHESMKFTKQVGYFLGVKSQGDLDGPFSYTGSVQFVNQNMSILDNDFTVNAVNFSFYYGVAPIESLKILAGVQMGYIVHADFNDTEIVDFAREQIGWTAGLSYDLLERLSVEGRYIGALNDQLFDYTIQIGVNYRISKAN